MPLLLRILLPVAIAAGLAYLLIEHGRSAERQACANKQLNDATLVSESRRADEGATSTARMEASDDQIQAIRLLVDQRNAADLAAGRLRIDLAKAVQRAQRGAEGDPAAEQGRQAAAALGAVLAACEARHRELAAAAAEHLTTGIRCEAEYDALTAGQAASTPAEGAGE